MPNLRPLLVLALLSALSLTAGCGKRVVIVERRPADPPPVIIDNPPSDPTIAEIHAVRSLSLENSRMQRLSSIARRDGLSHEAQPVLVAVTMHDLSLESSRLMVINTLIENPAFCDAGRAAILEHLEDFSLESSRLSVLNQLDAHR